MTRPAAGAGESPASVLAIDTATTAASVALRARGETRVRGLPWRDSFRAAAAAIEQLVADSGIAIGDLDAVGVAAGPGSFTGLRVGAALALGLCRVSDAPLHALPTLAAVAEAGASSGSLRVCATIDARRGRRYAAVYERAAPGRWRLVAGPLDGTPEQVAELAGGSSVVSLDPIPIDASSPNRLATAMIALMAADPGRYVVPVEEFHLHYIRRGIDSP